MEHHSLIWQMLLLWLLHPHQEIQQQLPPTLEIQDNQLRQEIHIYDRKEYQNILVFELNVNPWQELYPHLTSQVNLL